MSFKRASLAVMVCAVFGSTASAGEFVAFNEANHQARMVQAYARAAGLRPLRADGVSQLRIWVDNPESGNVTGYVVVRAGIRMCRVDIENTSDGVAMRRGSCEPIRPNSRKTTRLFAMFDDLATLNERSIACDTVDGWQMLVEGLNSGKSFLFYAVNPDQCNDPLAQRARRVTDVLWARSEVEFP